MFSGLGLQDSDFRLGVSGLGVRGFGFRCLGVRGLGV